MANGWKITAIVLMVLLILETALIVWAVQLSFEETDNINECYYDICSGYYDAGYDEELCTCYDLDMMDNYVIAKEEWMG